MRVSGALQRMGHIAHESLRSCSVPLVDGSMRDERAAIQTILAVIDSELCDLFCVYCFPVVLVFVCIFCLHACVYVMNATLIHARVTL